MSTETKSDASFLEAPASWNTRYVTPAGFVCQITLRGENGKDLLEKASLALTYLVEHDNQPESNLRKNGNGETKMCPIHRCEMTPHEKEGKTWFSHKTNQGWCKGKVASKGGNHG